MAWVQRAAGAVPRWRPAASAPLPPLSIGSSDGVRPDGGCGKSNGNSDNGDSDDGDSDNGGCRGAALTELTREDAVGSGDNDLRFSIATGQRGDNKGSDVSSLTNGMIPQDEDDGYGGGEEDKGKKTSGGGG